MSKDPILRKAEKVFSNPHIEARTLVEGKWSPLDTS